MNLCMQVWAGNQRQTDGRRHLRRGWWGRWGVAPLPALRSLDLILRCFLLQKWRQTHLIWALWVQIYWYSCAVTEHGGTHGRRSHTCTRARAHIHSIHTGVWEQTFPVSVILFLDLLILNICYTFRGRKQMRNISLWGKKNHNDRLLIFLDRSRSQIFIWSDSSTEQVTVKRSESHITHPSEHAHWSR